MKKTLWLIGCLMIITGPVWGEQPLKHVDEIIQAPELGLQDLDNKLWKIADLKGQPAIINFWATWCPPCREEMPSMEKAWLDIKDEGIMLMAIAYGEEREAVEAFEVEYPMSFPVLLDSLGTTGRSWPVKGLPTTFVLDSDGRIVYEATGAREWDNEVILDQVRALKKP